MKDWTGNSKSIYTPLGASSHTSKEREENDYYATEPTAVKFLLEQEQFSHHIWECACGEGHISKVLEEQGYDVYSSDLIYRGYGDDKPFDFLKDRLDNFDGDIITNPPYKFAQEFVERAVETVKDGRRVAMFLKLTFLETQSRRLLFDKYPPRTVYVFSGRVRCGKNGDFYDRDKNGCIKYDTKGEPKLVSSAVAYAWFVWEKGFKGSPIIKWIN